MSLVPNSVVCPECHIMTRYVTWSAVFVVIRGIQRFLLISQNDHRIDRSDQVCEARCTEHPLQSLGGKRDFMTRD